MALRPSFADCVMATDFDYEMFMSGMNGVMAPSLETVFLAVIAGRPPYRVQICQANRGDGGRCLTVCAGEHRRALENQAGGRQGLIARSVCPRLATGGPLPTNL